MDFSDVHKLVEELTAERDRLNNLHVKVRYISDDVPRLKKIEKGDWIDVYAAENVNITAGQMAKVSLGFAMELPDGYEAYLLPRSSTFSKWGVLEANSMGVIDNSYCGNNDIWSMPVYSPEGSEIKKGDRIGQFRIMKKMPSFDIIEVDELTGKDRGGFGSTGTGVL